jgi:hypothetical protein
MSISIVYDISTPCIAISVVQSLLHEATSLVVLRDLSSLVALATSGRIGTVSLVISKRWSSRSEGRSPETPQPNCPILSRVG